MKAADLSAWCAQALEACGVPSTEARLTAGALVEADQRGLASHGVMMLPLYIERIRAGSVSPTAHPTVVTDVGAIAVLDGQHGLGQIAAHDGMDLAIRKAREFGLGVVVIRHAFHFGGAYGPARLAADQGLVGVAACNTRPLMPAPGGATRVVGNNPLAIAMPQRDAAPVILDMAMSEAAMGKIRLAAASGRDIPATWAADADGRPTTDPSVAIAGMLLPAAGPKGYGLALMIDLLTGGLAGGAVGSNVQGLFGDRAVPYDCSHFFLAIDPAVFGTQDELLAAVAQLSDEVHGSLTVEPGARALLPGEREEKHAQGCGDDVMVDETTLVALDALAASLAIAGVPR
ncbi:MAG: Ldh family oxidoreductase [Actinomycetes bacterium]